MCISMVCNPIYEGVFGFCFPNLQTSRILFLKLSRNLWCLMTCCAAIRVEAERQPITRTCWRCFVWCTAAKELQSLLWTIPRKSTVCDHKSTLPPDSPGEPTAGLEAATVLQTHQRPEVAASFRQELAKPSPLEPNQVARLSQKVEGDVLLPPSL